MSTQGRRSCGGRGRDWSDVIISQRKPKISNKHQELDGKHGTDSHSEHTGEPILLLPWF